MTLQISEQIQHVGDTEMHVIADWLREQIVSLD